MAYSTTEACEYVRQMDSADRIADSPSDKKQKAAATRSKYVILLYRSLHVPPESWDRSADTSWHRSYQWFVMLHARLALDSPLESFVCYVVACARQNDFTLTMKNKLAGWDAPMSQIVFSAATRALSSPTSSLLFGETLGSTFDKINCFTPSSLKPFQEAFNVGSWWWVLSTPWCTPTTITVTIRTIQEISTAAWKGESAF